jgi:hypothetical protein
MAGLNKLQLQVFGRKVNYEPNTFIGGVGLTIVSATNLASLLLKPNGSAFPSSSIKNFIITGSDISCEILEDYRFIVGAFYNNNSITYYDDSLNGKCIDIDANIIDHNTFRNCDELLWVKFPSVNRLGSNGGAGRTFGGNLKLQNAEFGELSSIGNGCFKDNPVLASILGIVPTTLLNQNGGFMNTPMFEMELTNNGNIPGEAFRSSGIKKLTTLGNIGNSSFRGASKLTELIADSATTVGNNSIRDTSSITLVSIKMCKNLGGNPTGDSVFTGIKIGCLIKTNIFLATNNAGGADADLTYAKTTRGCTVEFYDDSGNYVSTL